MTDTKSSGSGRRWWVRRSLLWPLALVVVLSLASVAMADVWSGQSSGTSAQLNGLSCASASDCVTAGVSGTIETTSDAGATWSPQTSGTTDDLQAVSCAATSDCVGVGASGTTLATTNGGSSWSSGSSGVSSALSGVSCADASDCIAVGAGGTIVASTDGGSTWSAQTSGTTDDLNGVACTSTSSCVAVGANGTIVATSDGGSTWSAQTSGTTEPLNGLACGSASDCFAVGDSGTVIATTDGGSTWSAQTSGITDDLDGVACTSTSACWTAGDNGVILQTSDGGTTWTAQTSGTTDRLHAISCVGGGCWAVGDNGTIVNATAPANTTLPTVTGTERVGDTLTAHNGSWSGSLPIGYGYQWQSCDPAGGSCTDIDGATNDTYELDDGDVGSVVSVSVTATNAEGADVAAAATDVIDPATGPSCTDSWMPADGAWETASNWSSATVPTSSDVVCMRKGSAPTVNDDDQQAATVHGGRATIAIDSGYLQLSSSSGNSQLGTLTLDGGDLINYGSLSIETALDWTTGNLEGSGTTTLTESATSDIAPGATPLTLDAQTLTNEGHLTLTCAEGDDPTGTFSVLQGTDDASVVNDSTMTFVVPGGSSAALGCQLRRGDGTDPTFKNHGDLGALTGSGVGAVQVGWEFANGHDATVTGVKLALFGGQTSNIDGHWNNSTLHLSAGGDYTFDDDSSFGDDSATGSTIVVDAPPSSQGTGYTDFTEWLAGNNDAPTMTAGAVSWAWTAIQAHGLATLGHDGDTTTIGSVLAQNANLTTHGTLTTSGDFAVVDGDLDASGPLSVGSDFVLFNGTGEIDGSLSISEALVSNSATVEISGGLTAGVLDPSQSHITVGGDITTTGSVNPSTSTVTAHGDMSVGTSLNPSDTDFEIDDGVNVAGSFNPSTSSMTIASGGLTVGGNLNPSNTQFQTSDGVTVTGSFNPYQITMTIGAGGLTVGDSFNPSVSTFEIAGNVDIAAGFPPYEIDLTITGGGLSVGGWLIPSRSRITSSGPIDVTGAVHLDDETVLSSPSPITVDTAGFTAFDSTVTGGGTLTLPDNSAPGAGAAEVDGLVLDNETLINNGTLFVDGKLKGANGAVFENVGTIDADHAEFLPVPGGDAPVLNNYGAMVDTATPVRINLVAWDVGTMSGTIQSGAYFFGSELPPPTAPEFYGSSNAASPQQQRCFKGHPVDCATGNFFESQTDLAIGGRGPGLTLTRTYNAQAAANASSAGRFGFGWASAYSDHIDVDAGIATVTQANGSIVPFSIGSDGEYLAPARVQATLSQAIDGTFTYTLPDRTVMTFDSSGRLATQADANGNTVTLTYDGSGRLDEVTDPGGRTLEYSYNGDDTVSSVEDSDDRQVSYEYDDGDLVGVTDVRGGEWAFAYDSEHRMTSTTNPRGKTTTNTYDSADRVTSQTNPLSQTLTFAYDEDVDGGENTETTITHPGGAVEREVFVNFQPTKIVKASGTPEAASTDLEYDEDGNLTSVTDADGHATTLTYDSAGNRTSATNELDETTSWTYNSHRDVTSVTDPLDHVTTLTYDSNGNLTKVERELEETDDVADTTMVYNGFGELTSSTDPLDRETTFGYDGDGNLTTATTPEGNESTATYDDVSQIESVTSPRGNAPGATAADFTTTYERDAAGLPTTITDGFGHDTVYAYDEAGNVTSVTDRDGRETQFAYDDLGRQTTVTRPDDTELVTAYDVAGNVESKTDGRGKETAYDYDLLNRVVSVTDPLDRETTFDYDNAGNRTSLTDANGHTTTYGYDSINRLLSVDYDTSTPDVAYVYDDAGRRTSMSDGTGTSTYSYDTLDRLTSTTSGAGQTVGYHYDLAGQVTAIDYPDALTAVKVSSYNGPDHVTTGTVQREYDLDGNLTSVTDWLENTTEFSYDPDGNLTSTERPNDKDTTATFDRNDQLASLTDRGATVSYARTAQGLLSQAPVGGLANQALTRDDIARLTGVGTVDYAYDDSDNLTQTLNAQGIETNQTFDDANQLTEADPTTGPTTTFDYDANGNRTSATAAGAPAATFSWDQANQLIGYRSAPAQPAISSSGGHALGLQPDGTIKAWGLNDHGQLGDDTTTSTSTPQDIDGIDDATQVAAGRDFSLALLNDGTVKAWGADTHGQLGDADPVFPTTSVLDDADRSDASTLGSGWTTPTSAADPRIVDNTIAAEASGSLSAAYRDTSQGPDSEVFATIAAKDTSDAVKLDLRADPATGNGYVVSVANDLIDVSREDAFAETELASFYQPVAAGDSVGARIVGGRITVYYKPSGGDWTKVGHTGDTTYDAAGKIGFSIDTTTTRLDDFGGGTISELADAGHPQTVSGITGTVTAIAAGDGFALALDSDGQVWSWGDNSSGQLGDGTTIGHSQPENIGLYGIVAIAAGANHAIALDGWGNVYTWGDNTNDQLGPDRTGTTTSPGYVPDLAGATAIAAGDDFSTALVDGEVRAWGANDHHQLGDASSPSTPGTPVVTYDDEPVTTISAHGQTAIAQTADGDVIAWGSNDHGQLADGTTTDATPTDIPALSGAESVALGNGAGYTILANGTAKAWGDGADGQLGTGNTSDQTSPTTITSYTPDPAHTTTASYGYNGDGLRVTRTVDGLRTHQAYDDSTGLSTIITDGPTAYITGPGGLPLEQITANGLVRYYHQDQQGSTIALTDDAGDDVATYTYDAYGNETSSTGSAINPFRYNGQYTDAETGLQYLRARYYDPATGQFLSRDPIEDITGQPYAYAAGNPMDFADPTGLWPSLPDPPGFVKSAVGFVGDVGGGAANVAADAGMALSNASAATLDGLSGGLSTKLAARIFGFDADCVDFGTGGGAISFAASWVPIGRVSKGLTLADDVAKGVTGFTRHGINQAISRDGVGVSSRAILDTVRSPVSAIRQADGSVKYVGQNAVVVVSREGKIITTYATNSSAHRIR